MNKILDSLIGTQEMLNSQASGSTEFQASPGPSVQFGGISYSPPSQLASLTHYPSEF